MAESRTPIGPPHAAGPGSQLNRDFYEALSPGRQDYWRKMAAPRARMAAFLDLMAEDPFESLVDLGCGGGQLLAEIAERYPGVSLAGIDLSQSQIEANRIGSGKVDWRAADLDVPDAIAGEAAGRFDVVVASEIIEHVEHPRTFLANALALAAPGTGRLLLSTQSGPVRETERRVGHLRHFAVSEMFGLLEETGWIPARVWNCGFPFHDLSKWLANRNPDAMMRRFGDRPYGAGENLTCAALRFAFRFNSRRKGAQLFAVATRPGLKTKKPGGVVSSMSSGDRITS